MVSSGILAYSRCGRMTGKTFLRVRACSVSWVRQLAQVWVLDLLRLLVVQLRHCLMVDESSDYFSNTLCGVA